MVKRSVIGAVLTLIGAGPVAHPLSAERAATRVPSLFQSAPACVALATDPSNGLAGNGNVKSATSHVVDATGPNKSFCQVDLVYSSNPQQNIAIRVGLPLSAADGGA